MLPDIEFFTQGLLDAGITPLFHCDTDWTRFLHYFRRFPKASCIMELDGFTDIVKAKEILGDRMAIMGDVPSTLLAEGSRDEVLSYCRTLIETVGPGGGFILSSGCSIPANANQETIRALSEAIMEWGFY
ncbi:MAG: uroporphyrinogen decarboxylase family protein, partial [Desulfomonilia bacterium]|nr:uroporphyrinogen decarboxylase family protein [Desulfomonilia bacterium]